MSGRRFPALKSGVFWWGLGALVLLSPVLDGATLIATNGETYQGKVTLDSGLLFTPETGSAVKLDFNNVLWVRFGDDPASADQILPGVVLRNGTRIAGPIGSLAEPVMKFPKRNLSVPGQEIAWVIYQPMAAAVAEKLPEGTTGALLPGGDFFEGTIKSAEADGARVLSPIFGLRTFSATAKQKDFLALIVRDVKPAPALFVVRTTDGYTFNADALSADRSGLTLRSAALGMTKIEAKDLAEIAPGPNRYQLLTQLKPSRIDPPTGQTTPPAFAINASLEKEPLAAASGSVAHGIAAAVGVVATWNLPPGFTMLVAQVGLPPGADAGARVNFAVYADGKPVFRSPPCGLADRTLPVHANIAGARVLSLRVEPSAEQTTSSGVWIEPTLIRR